MWILEHLHLESNPLLGRSILICKKALGHLFHLKQPILLETVFKILVDSPLGITL